MQTDYQITGKTYPKLSAYAKGNASQAMPCTSSYYYFGSTLQFKTCKSFKAYLSDKHFGTIFKVERA